MASAPTCTCTSPLFQVFRNIDASSYVTDSVRPATSEVAVLDLVLRERLRAPHVSPPALRLTTQTQTLFSRRLPDNSWWQNSTLQDGTSPLLGFTVPHRTRLSLAAACHMTEINQSPLNALTFQHDAFFWRHREGGVQLKIVLRNLSKINKILHFISSKTHHINTLPASSLGKEQPSTHLKLKYNKKQMEI